MWVHYIIPQSATAIRDLRKLTLTFVIGVPA
jgi:hypothetical protein